jgi:hypothetical protein
MRAAEKLAGASRWRSSTWRRLAFFTPRPSWPSPTRRAATAVCNPCPKGATGFATAELNANFIGTAREGGVTCNARLVHGGRTTQLWDAEVKEERIGKTIALFRCTQILLYPDRVLSG